MAQPLVRDLMTTKLITVQPDHTITLAEGIMRMEGIHHLPVVEDGRLVGLLSRGDADRAEASFLSRTQLGGADAELNLPVEQVMTTSLHTVTPTTSALTAARLMRDNRYSSLPVIETGCLVGIITESDLLDLLIELLEHDKE